MIPYGRQHITQADIDAVVGVLRSDYLTQGNAVPHFEENLSRLVGAKYAVAVNSATSALHIACKALGLGEGDTLWTTPISFVASANCGLYCGASVDFVDIDPRTYNLCPDALEAKLESADRTGGIPRVLVVVHMCGQSCDMERIAALSMRFGFSVIEDASHAVGGNYKGEFIGLCRYSDITVFSFHPVKIITTGEGGMALTNNESLANRMSLLRSHGVTRDPQEMTHAPDGPWYYQQIELGFNYRMTDFQAALGGSQLDRLEEYISRRRMLATQYDQALAGLPLVVPWQHPDTASARHLYVVRIELDRIRSSRREVFEAMRARGVGVNVHYIPIHTQPFYKKMGFVSDAYPQAMQFYAEAMSLPLYYSLSDGQQDTVVEALKEVLGT